MRVKDLVGRYETEVTPMGTLPESSRSAAARGYEQARRRIPSSADDDDDEVYPMPSLKSTPARFVSHAPRVEHGESNGDPPTVGFSSSTASHNTTLQDRADDGTLADEQTLDVTDMSRPRSLISSMTAGASASDHTFVSAAEFEEHRHLLSKDHHQYPPDDRVGRALLSERSMSPTIPRPTAVPHKPIPATTVFARHAAPLYLPKLDKFLSTLASPSFSHPSRSDGPQDGGSPMFPPMSRLAALGRSIEDLETNAVVTPSWRNRNSIMGGLSGAILGFAGSSALAAYYSLQGLFNTLQMFALLLSTIVPHAGQDLEDKWKKLFLGTIPNVIALNIASSLVQSLAFLMVLMMISSLLLYYFYRATRLALSYTEQEGLQSSVPGGNQWSLVIVSFVLTVIYLPLSTMAVHVLAWSEDLWVVPNPYTNATTYPPTVAPLGPPDQFRDPLDFCWTTTMRRDSVNVAPIVIILSIVVVLTLTIWFPIRLRQVIRQAAPKVDPFTELGRRRAESEMDREYERLLDRDRNPFSFLYRGYRRNWGTYESIYIFAKLTTLLIVAIFDPNNCFFRSLQKTPFPVVREALTLAAMVAFFIMQCIWAPCIDPVNNASEWTSRLNYVLTAAVAVAVAANVPGQAVLNGPILYIIYIVTYGLSFYFTIIDFSFMHRVVKRLARRIDFSIDIFSPHLDITPSSHHTRRRIWQESITTLLLTCPECKIPEKQRMIFAQAHDSEYPPYLLDFANSPGERHVENLKILREVGSAAYGQAVALVSGPQFVHFKRIEEDIVGHFIGPDSFWKDMRRDSRSGSSFFGNAWWIPFPPTVVIRYDDGPLAVINDISQLELYVSQNASEDIRRRRAIRMALRALDGQTVRWPYDHHENVGSTSIWCCGCCGGRKYRANTSTHYETCVLNIKRHGHLGWQDVELGSGFDVELTYTKSVCVGGEVIGLNDDYDLTPALARFLNFNERLIPLKLDHIETALHEYRMHCREECLNKATVLTYRFLSFVYDRPRNDPAGLAESSIEFEQDSRVRQLMLGSEAVFETALERLSAATTSPAATWWYIFWDDLWRRNNTTIKALQMHAPDFNPYYPTSIAYKPISRPTLESFLIQRGLMSKTPNWRDVFNPGLLNKMYLRLNDIVFRGSSQAVLLHLGHRDSELDMEGVDVETALQPSTLGTGGGTDHDDSSIRARPQYKWETLLADPLGTAHRRWFAKLGAWFGITPYFASSMASSGLALDVRLEGGKYVLLKRDGREVHTVGQR